jgi:hypothetical protein
LREIVPGRAESERSRVMGKGNKTQKREVKKPKKDKKAAAVKK